MTLYLFNVSSSATNRNFERLLEGAGGLADPLPYHFPQGMLGISLTSSENNEANSTGMSPGQRQLLVAQVLHLEHNTLSVGCSG